MIISDLLEETYSAIFANKARSGLTILGIVIGIGSVIAMISIGAGAKGQIQSSIESIGSNLIMVMPGFQRGVGTQISSGRGSATTLTLEDANAILENISLVQAVSPEVSGRYQVTARGTNTNTQVVGTVTAYQEVRNINTESGSFISESQNKSLAKVAVLGPTTRDDLFGEGTNPIGQTIRIKQVDFKVIGITQSKGGTGSSNQDDMIFIPLSTAQTYLAGRDRISTIYVQATSQSVMATLKQEITNLLLGRHNISDPQLADFQVLSQEDILATASTITNTLTILLASIAGISLLVGGIGIMNMMLTTVTERTREIGLRKAIGAKKKDISLQFLTESVMITFFGGVLGIAFGWIVSLLITHFAGNPTSVTLSAIILAVGVSAVIGIAFGYYPALRAAKLNPIEALRYE